MRRRHTPFLRRCVMRITAADDAADVARQNRMHVMLDDRHDVATVATLMPFRFFMPCAVPTPRFRDYADAAMLHASATTLCHFFRCC